MSYRLGPRSLLNLRGVHPDLVKVVKKAIEISEIDFTVIEGLRSKKRQGELVAKGASMTTRSRHIHGFAVDIAPYVAGQVRWDWPLFLKLAQAMKKASHQLAIPVRWGGTWKLLADTPTIDVSVLHKRFPDGPHFELPVANYPDPKQ